MILVFLLLMPISMAYVGVKNLSECPREPKIPIYLFVGGLVGLLKILQAIYDHSIMRHKEKMDQGDDEFNDMDDEYEGGGGMSGGAMNGGGAGGDSSGDFNTSSRFINFVVSAFLFIWFILGNYWVWSIWKPNFKQPREVDSQNWCSRNAYMTALVHIGIVYAMAALFFLLMCVLFIAARCRSINQASDEITENNIENA